MKLLSKYNLNAYVQNFLRQCIYLVFNVISCLLIIIVLLFIYYIFRENLYKYKFI